MRQRLQEDPDSRCHRCCQQRLRDSGGLTVRHAAQRHSMCQLRTVHQRMPCRCAPREERYRQCMGSYRRSDKACYRADGPCRKSCHRRRIPDAYRYSCNRKNGNCPEDAGIRQGVRYRHRCRPDYNGRRFRAHRQDQRRRYAATDNILLTGMDQVL